jgi:hypothetical protein
VDVREVIRLHPQTEGELHSWCCLYVAAQGLAPLVDVREVEQCILGLGGTVNMKHFYDPTGGDNCGSSSSNSNSNSNGNSNDNSNGNGNSTSNDNSSKGELLGQQSEIAAPLALACPCCTAMPVN